MALRWARKKSGADEPNPMATNSRSMQGVQLNELLITMSSGDPSLERTPTHSPHVQSGVVAKVGLTNKVSDQKVGGSTEISTPQVGSQVSTDQNLHPAPAQTSSANLQSLHQPSPARNYVSVASLYSNHIDIAKNVQKFLQPRPSEHPNWTPPSTDYMNKSLTCQICKTTIHDVESLLVCDACEKGVHLKCLQSYNQKGIPKLEWHCPKCLISSSGKHLPPKYGRVTRSITLPKVLHGTTGDVQVSSGKPENPDHKVSHQKITTNRNTDSLNSAHVDHGGSGHAEIVSDPMVAKPSALPAAPYSASDRKMENDSLSESKPNQNENKRAFAVPPAETLKEGSNLCVENGDSSTCDPDHKLSDTKAEVDPVETLNPTAVSSGHRSEVKKSDLGENGGSNPQLGNDDKGIGKSHLSNGMTDLKSTPDGLLSVEWVGDVHQLMDEKTFYKSCNINGRVYKLDDFALFRSSEGVLRPSKLQACIFHALWEDTKTGMKWAVMNRCYFPADLPEVVGRPCTPETDEVEWN
ncbi:hypothetical protein Syun_016629 [Stephania yunnanensis]|uniref:PHD-type domain-containing protein n=1 Tax=Stephania yunnanensis TaxID=152371 RepID=A0AAP0J7T6_9MAGN